MESRPVHSLSSQPLTAIPNNTKAHVALEEASSPGRLSFVDAAKKGMDMPRVKAAGSEITPRRASENACLGSDPHRPVVKRLGFVPPSVSQPPQSCTEPQNHEESLKPRPSSGLTRSLQNSKDHPNISTEAQGPPNPCLSEFERPGKPPSNPFACNCGLECERNLPTCMMEAGCEACGQCTLSVSES